MTTFTLVYIGLAIGIPLFTLMICEIGRKGIKT